ncbi:MAG: hypothetical protein ACYC8T_08925 [Myxococcaceae bacterium]
MALLLREGPRFELARRVQSRQGAPLGEVFRFASGLYFRGKLAYAQAFGRPPDGVGGGLVIVPGDGLMDAEEPVRAKDIRAFAQVPVDVRDPRYREPLERDVRRLLRKLGRQGEAVLLGSVASGKYVDVLLGVLGDQLRFPPAFVGRGDMSRGGLMLRCAASGLELDYVPVRGAVRHGPRPPKLPPIDWTGHTTLARLGR